LIVLNYVASPLSQLPATSQVAQFISMTHGRTEEVYA